MTTASPSPRRLFIAGATGAIGQTLLPIADAHSVPTLAHARAASASKLAGRPHTTVDLADTERLAAAMAGCTTVVQLIGTMRRRFAQGDTYEASDIGTTRSLVAAAGRVRSVDHIVLLSSVGAGTPVFAYLQAKAEAERIVRDSGIAWTALRPSSFADREGSFLPGARSLLGALGLQRIQPIRLHEVAVALLIVATRRAPLGEALEGKSLWQQVVAGLAAFGEQ